MNVARFMCKHFFCRGSCGPLEYNLTVVFYYSAGIGHFDLTETETYIKKVRIFFMVYMIHIIWKKYSIVMKNKKYNKNSMR